MKYCTHCGKEIMDDAVICMGCGCATGKRPSATQNPSIDYISELSKRVRINGIIWICVAAIQLILALTVNYLVAIVGVLNLVSGIRDLSYSKEVMTNHSGIVARFENLAGPIIVLIYNVIFGGIIGVAGSIYYLVGIRGFVLNNKDVFSDYDIPV